jgi:hypothetical protein
VTLGHCSWQSVVKYTDKTEHEQAYCSPCRIQSQSDHLHLLHFLYIVYDPLWKQSSEEFCLETLFLFPGRKSVELAKTKIVMASCAFLHTWFSLWCNTATDVSTSLAKAQIIHAHKHWLKKKSKSPAILTEVLCGFPQFLQANVGTLLQIKTRPLPSTYFTVH